MDFEQFVHSNEPAIRLGFFVGIFVLIAIWELVAPQRVLTVSKTIRWCRRRFNIDHPCRLNFDQGLKLAV